MSGSGSKFAIRKQKLEDSLAYHQFKVDADEEESWISEKVAVATNKEVGENMATTQGLLKKQEAFDADLNFHRGQVEKIEFCGEELISQVIPSVISNCSSSSWGHVELGTCGVGNM